MATAAVRVQKRELEPHWRDTLRASVKRLVLRTWGALLFGLSVATALALATHNTTDPSFSTAAGGPPSNWIGSFGAYASDALLLLFGMGSVLFIPVIALAGLRMMRLEPTGRIGRALLVSGLGAILIGVALSLTSASAVSGLPGGWGGAIGLGAAYGVDSAIDLIQNQAIAGPVRLVALVLFACASASLAASSCRSRSRTATSISSSRASSRSTISAISAAEASASAVREAMSAPRRGARAA